MSLEKAKKIVIKIGSNILTDLQNQLDLNNMRALVKQICFLKSKGKDVVVVSSGAILSGSSVLGYKPIKIPEKQAAAAIGQTLLLDKYQSFFNFEGYYIAQILLTLDVILDQERLTNTKNTIETILERKNIIPIVNENDTVAVDEIKFSDNDSLSAEVAQIIGADYLIILTDIDGVYNKDPRVNQDAYLLHQISDLSTAMIEELGGCSHKGTGGMKTKLLAAKEAIDHKIEVVIANGRDNLIINKLYENQEVGTKFI